MKLLTKEIEKKLPPLYSQENKGENAIVQAKFFCPWNHWTWYATEYDPTDKLFFGYVDGDFGELGYFALEELESIHGPFGLKIERDLHFRPISLKEVMSKCQKY